MLNGPFSPWPSFTEEESEAVQRVLLSGKVNYWTGREGREFEREFAAFAGTEYAVALANGTVALELALKALDIGSGDEVVVTPRTFLASVSSIVATGAVPVFADVDRDSQNITAGTVAEKIGPRTRAIMVVHLAGWPCDMDPIMDLAKEHGLYVVEDCAQAHGAKYRGRPVGSIGHVGAWSFCQDKIMTTGGEGGMLTTSDEALWKWAWAYKDHGKSFDAVYNRDHPPGFRWLHESLGTNWRLTEMQSAIGRIQLRKLPDWLQIRQRNASILCNHLSKLDCLRVPWPPDHIRHAFYKFYVFVKPERLRAGWSRDLIMKNIQECGVWCQQGSCPEVYMERVFENTKWRPPERLAVAQELGETSLMFSVDPTLTEEDMQHVAQSVEGVLARACL